MLYPFVCKLCNIYNYIMPRLSSKLKSHLKKIRSLERVEVSRLLSCKHQRNYAMRFEEPLSLGSLAVMLVVINPSVGGGL